MQEALEAMMAYNSNANLIKASDLNLGKIHHDQAQNKRNSLLGCILSTEQN